jgi:hypothetical protein
MKGERQNKKLPEVIKMYNNTYAAQQPQQQTTYASYMMNRPVYQLQ